jgi:hypothetical protein
MVLRATPLTGIGLGGGSPVVRRRLARSWEGSDGERLWWPVRRRGRAGLAWIVAGRLVYPGKPPRRLAAGISAVGQLRASARLSRRFKPEYTHDPTAVTGTDNVPKMTAGVGVCDKFSSDSDGRT